MHHAMYASVCTSRGGGWVLSYCTVVARLSAIAGMDILRPGQVRAARSPVLTTRLRWPLPVMKRVVVWCLKAKAANAGHAALISSTTLHTACDVCLCVARSS